MSIDFQDFLNEEMKDPEFRREYEALEFETGLAHAITEAREARGLTRKQLAKMAGVKEKEVEDFEYVNKESTINLFHKLASVLGLKPEFLPA